MNCSTTSNTGADNNSAPPKSEYKRLVDYSHCRAQTPPRLVLSAPVAVCELVQRSPLVGRGAPRRPIVMMTDTKDRASFGVGCFGRGSSCLEASTVTPTTTSSSTAKRDSLSTLATTTTTATSDDVQLLQYSSSSTPPMAETPLGLAKNRSQKNLRPEQQQGFREEPPSVIQVVFAKGKAPFGDSTTSTKSSNTVVLLEQDASQPEVSVPTESNHRIHVWKGVAPHPQRAVPARSWSLKTLAGDLVVDTSSVLQQLSSSTTRRSSMSFVAGSQIRTIHRG